MEVSKEGPSMIFLVMYLEISLEEVQDHKIRLEEVQI
jgi:hypothetical protein